MDNIFLYLLGFAGTGKLTIARAFARSVGAKVVDNHWINNPIFGLIDPDGVSPLPDAVWSQTARVREAVLETIATLAKPGTNFVFTHDGIEGERYDEDVLQGIQSTAARRGARLIPVRLVCNEDETCTSYPIGRSRSHAQMHRSRRRDPQESPPRRTRSKAAWDSNARRDKVDARAKRRGNYRAHQRSRTLSNRRPDGRSHAG
jgi:hypothetical protein